MKAIIKVDVRRCARCRGDHNKLHFKKLIFPIEAHEEYTHFALCPKNNQPILMRVYEQTD
jgi:hypothetical protein